ncbi:MAG: TetR family transcriptional regulator [Alcanivoracaceae bacterium]|nr:TetR family transcriptional regulator [Alcanivoracaceae bacterium]
MARCRECFTRARRPEEIAQRREEIVAAAATLLDDQPLDAISLNAIARQAGLAKSAVYRYFESREAIFLKILERDWRDWMDEADYALIPFKGSNDVGGVAGALTRATVGQPRMCTLVSSLASVLERNLSEEAVLAFKQESLALAMRLVNSLHAALPAVPAHRLVEFLNPAFALIAGLWPLCHPSDTVRAVMARPEFAPFQPDFEGQFRRTLGMTLTGLMEECRANA